MLTANMCLHCLEEGAWADEDKCPRCAAAGHTSPWEVGRCPACQLEYQQKMDKLMQKAGLTRSDDADLRRRVTDLERRAVEQDRLLRELSSRLAAAELSTLKFEARREA